MHHEAEIRAREDVELSRSTIADMVGQMAPLVRPLVDVLARHVMAGERVHAQDTVVPVLEPGVGRTRTARLWTYVRDDRPFAGAAPPAMLYRYSPDARVNTRARTCRIFALFCRPMATLALPRTIASPITQ